MTSLAINFWDKCNNKCVFCFCREHDLLSEKLDASVTKSPKKIGQALLKYKNKCDFIIISGNEPTLNPQLLLAVLLAKKIGYKVDLRTNGRSLRDKTLCRSLFMAGVDMISITLLSFDSKTHDFLSNAKGAFADTVKGIQNVALLWDPEKIRIYNVVTKYNYKQLKKSVAFYHKLGIKNVQFNFVYHTDAKIVPSLTDVEKNLKAAMSNAIKFKMNASVYGFPLCFLGKYFKLSSELTLHDEVSFGSRIPDYKKVRINLGKKKTCYCSACKYDSICEGTWKAYYKIYGEEEFKNRKIYEKS